MCFFNNSESVIEIGGKTFRNEAAAISWLISEVKSIKAGNIDKPIEFTANRTSIQESEILYSDMVDFLISKGLSEEEAKEKLSSFGLNEDVIFFNEVDGVGSQVIGVSSILHGNLTDILGNNNLIGDESNDADLCTVAGCLNQFIGSKSNLVGYYLSGNGNNVFLIGNGGLSGKRNENNWEQKYWQILFDLGFIESTESPLKVGVVKANTSGQIGSNNISSDPEEEQHPHIYQYLVGLGNVSKGRAIFGAGYQNIAIGRDLLVLGTRNYIRNIRGGYSIGNTNEAYSTESDPDVAGIFQFGLQLKNIADSTFNIGIANNANHENVYLFGREITSGGEYQWLMGRRPAATNRTLFAIGDGGPTRTGNAFVIYKNSEGRAVQCWINCNLDTEGYIHSRGKMTADVAPTEPNDVVRKQELDALREEIISMLNNN